MQRLLIALFFLLCSVPAVHADAVLKDREQPDSYLFPLSVSVRTSVNGQVAVTTTKQIFRNTTNRAIRLQYGFPLGVNASVTDFSWYQHGQQRTAKLTGKPQDTVSGGPGGVPDAAYLSFLGKAPFIFSFADSLAPDSTLSVELTYIELVQYVQGRMAFSYPLKRFGQEQFAFDMQFDLQSSRRIESVESSHSMEFERSDFTVKGVYNNENEAAADNMVVRYRLDQKELGAYLLSTKPSQDDGYFIMIAEPDPETSPEKAVKKVFTFIVDISGSMAGVKIEQAREAALYCIGNLNARDQFNIIAFSSLVRKFRPQPVDATAENVDSGLEYIRGLKASGGTNLQDAVLQGLVQDMSDTTANVIVFLTDGQAALDQETVVKANTKNVRIFVFGIGTDVDQNLLQQLAANNNGLADFLGTDDVESRVGAFYNKIRYPLLLSPSLSFSAGGVFEVYPLHLPDIYIGEQLIVLGRYKQPGAAEALLAGKTGDKPLEYRYNVEFSGDSLANMFLPKMWAKYKIDALLVLMSGVEQGSNQWNEWKAEIIRLSLLYGIMTPFSSFTDPGQPTYVAEFEDVKAPAPMVHSYPNPASERVMLTLDDSVRVGAVPVEVVIRDAVGREVCKVLLAPGSRSFEWHGRDAVGRLVPGGVYMVTFVVDGMEYVHRVAIVR